MSGHSNPALGRAIRLAIAALLATPWNAHAAPRTLSLTEAVGLALDNAPAVVQAEGQIRASHAQVRAAYAAFVPAVSLSAGATRQLVPTGTATRVENGQVIILSQQPWSSNGSLGANVELFGGGSRIFDLQQAHSGEKAARANQVAQRFLTELQVKQQYFNVLAARESETAARAQLEQAERQLRDAVAKLRSQSATKSDSLRSEIQVRNAELALLTAQNDRNAAEAGLGRLVGESEPVTASGTDVGEAVTLGLDQQALLALADQGPLVRQAEADLANSQAGRWGALARYLPTVSASYSRGASGTSQGFELSSDYSYTSSMRLSLSFPLFDQLNREQQVVQASVAVDDAEAALRDAHLAARQNLVQALGDFNTAVQRADAQSATVDAAEEDLRVQQQRYAAGSATLLDALASQTQLTQARQALIRARYDARIAKAQLEALVGRQL